MNRFGLCASLTVALAFAAPGAACPRRRPRYVAGARQGDQGQDEGSRDGHPHDLQPIQQGGRPAEAEQQNFSADLYKLCIEAQQGGDQADDVGIDFDVFLDAQDLDAITDVTTKFTAAGDDKGTVTAKFTAFGKTEGNHLRDGEDAEGLEDRQHLMGDRPRRPAAMLTELKAEHTKSQMMAWRLPGRRALTGGHEPH